MLQNIQFHQKSTSKNQKFSIIIPTWNNLPYLKNCLESIAQNSHFEHQIIVVVNEGLDGTRAFLEKQTTIDYLVSEKNIGICFGLNVVRPLIKTNYVVYANDDMYLLPNWDLRLSEKIDEIGHELFMLSATMIEPTETGNPCVLVGNYGQNIADFDREKLLADFPKFQKKDWSGATWPPNLMPVKLWDLVGCMSIEFSPGMYSDPDLSMKLWQAGVRHFQGVGASLVYHFGSKSTKKVRKNSGKTMFLKKWGITSNTFSTHFLRRGAPFLGPLPEPNLSAKTIFLNKIKRLF
jgi:glycosyltransferase involved in cell wall biosynthesis